MKILLVDDDAFVRDMTAMILESGGYQVETAGSGKEAWEKYTADATIGLIVTDMNMPEMNGLELIKAVRAVNGTLPLILLTGDEEKPPNHEGHAINSFLTKDENLPENILQAVDTVLTAK